MVLRKADLQTSFFRGGMQCEDVQDQRGSVDNLNGLRHDLLDVGLLRRRQFVVEDNQIGMQFPAELGDFLRFAASHKGAGIGGRKLLSGNCHRFRTGGPGESL